MVTVFSLDNYEEINSLSVSLEYSLTEQNKVLKSNSKTVFIDLIFNFGTICI